MHVIPQNLGGMEAPAPGPAFDTCCLVHHEGVRASLPRVLHVDDEKVLAATDGGVEVRYERRLIGCSVGGHPFCPFFLGLPVFYT